VEDGEDWVLSSGMSWEDACDRKLCKLESRLGDGKRELGQMAAVQHAVKYILEGFDPADMRNVDWAGFVSHSLSFIL
jgi:hypothetical protein